MIVGKPPLHSTAMTAKAQSGRSASGHPCDTKGGRKWRKRSPAGQHLVIACTTQRVGGSGASAATAANLLRRSPRRPPPRCPLSGRLRWARLQDLAAKVAVLGIGSVDGIGGTRTGGTRIATTSLATGVENRRSARCPPWIVTVPGNVAKHKQLRPCGRTHTDATVDGRHTRAEGGRGRASARERQDTKRIKDTCPGRGHTCPSRCCAP